MQHGRCHWNIVSKQWFFFSGYSIMDNTVSFYLTNVGSIPASRTNYKKEKYD